MLVNFRVSNYRSIKKEVELSFETAGLKTLPQNVIDAKLSTGKSFNLLKTVSIYGPNASGKSNIVKALSLMQGMVSGSQYLNKGDQLPYDPFRLDYRYEKEPTSFEISIIIDKIMYEYGFKYNKEYIKNEYLYYYPNGRKSIIFERDNDSDCSDVLGCYKFTIDKNRQEFISSMTSKNKLYLSSATNLEYEKTSSVFNWIKDKLVIHTTETNDTWKKFTTSQLNDITSKKKILNFLKGADFKINNIESNDVKINIDDSSLESIKTLFSDEMISSITGIKEMTEISTFKSGLDMEGNNVQVSFDISNESDGTIKFYELAGPFTNMISRGCCIVYDELDIKLHPNLIIFLINLFNKNITNAQMVFTTHNVIALDQKYLRRDQIYLVDMLRDGSSDLYSIVDFKEEKLSSNLAKRYITGRYNAVPYVDEDIVIDSLMENIDGQKEKE